jgi:hypothetical protein
VLRLRGLQLFKIGLRQLDVLSLGDFIAFHQFASFDDPIADRAVQLLLDS